MEGWRVEEEGWWRGGGWKRLSCEEVKGGRGGVVEGWRVEEEEL